MVAAVRAIADLQQRLERQRTIVTEKRPVIGDGYIGGDIVDLGARILSAAAALVESAKEQTRVVRMKDRTGAGQAALTKSAEGTVSALEAFVAAAVETVTHEEGASAKVQESRARLATAIAAFQAKDVRSSGSPELNQVIERLSGSVQAMLKQLGSFIEAAERARTSQAAATVTTDTARAPTSVRRLSQNNPMLEVLEAEAKVVACRRELQFAENMLKTLTAK
jgi:hypothetical protein